MTPAFLPLTFIIVSSALLALIFRILKQPDILAYLLIGALIGALGFFNLSDIAVIELLSQLGITLLLFMVGLELTTNEIKHIGRVALLTGLGQIIFTASLGFLIALFLKFSVLESLYLSLALTFSSTIIVVKLLSTKQDLQSLYGKIAIGFLLVQDFVAILVLIFLSSFSPGELPSMSLLLLTLIKGFFLFALIFYLSQDLLPKIANLLAQDTDILFLLSLAWCLGFASFVASPLIGFSAEIGGFLAGVALANSMEHFQIATRIRPLRDLFIVMFFIVLGSKLYVSMDSSYWGTGLLFSLFVLVGNPLIVLGIMGLLGYTKKTSFLASVTVAQISEFSFILVALGEKVGHISSEIVALVTFVGIITMTLSTYLILFANRLYLILESPLSIFERSSSTRERLEVMRSKFTSLKDHIVLVGCGRKGAIILKALLKRGFAVLLIDHNPHVLKELKEKTAVLYGDISDEEIQNHAQIKNAALIISTVPDISDNLSLLSALRDQKGKPRIIVCAKTLMEAKGLYEANADYVLLPHFISGEFIKALIEKEKDFVKKLMDLRGEHLKQLFPYFS